MLHTKFTTNANSNENGSETAILIDRALEHNSALHVCIYCKVLVHSTKNASWNDLAKIWNASKFAIFEYGNPQLFLHFLFGDTLIIPRKYSLA